MAGPRDPFFEGLAGTRLPSDARGLGQAIRLLRDALFAGRRDKTKAIAEFLDVSPRQARRLMAGEVKTAKPERLNKVRDEMRTNPLVRRAAVTAGKSPRAGRPVQVTVTGNGGPVIGDSDHSGRPRPPIALVLTPEQYETLRAAFADGGAPAALDELNQHGDQYFENFRWSRVDPVDVR
jgi:hypothetical protein